jgi:hypothetical protein
LRKNVSSPALILDIRCVWLAFDDFLNLESRVSNVAHGGVRAKEVELKRGAGVPKIFNGRRVFADVKAEQKSSAWQEDPQHFP